MEGKEYLELYDINMHPTGVTVLRGEKQPEGMYHLVAAVWIFGSDGSLLVTRRSKNKKDWPCTLENPGGALRPGETMAEGVLRELYEETGIKACADELILLGNVPGSTAIYGLYMLMSDISVQDLHLQTDEVSEAMRISAEEFFALMDEGAFAPPIKKRFLAVKDRFIAELYARTGVKAG